MLFALSIGNLWAETLFLETFGDNNASAREWNDSYSAKSGVSTVYSDVTYTITNAKQTKNTLGQTKSGLSQSLSGKDAVFIVGPLDVADYKNLEVSYYWKAGSIKKQYSTKLYYATSSSGTYTEISTTAKGATTFVKCSYTLPDVAQCATLYLKVVFNTSNTQAVIDEFELKEIGVQQPTISLTPQEMTLNVSDASKEISSIVENYTGNLSWTCSAEGIIKLTPSIDTKTATIEPLAVGTCDVTVSATVAGKTYSSTCRVTVAPAVPRYTITYETNGGTTVEKSEQQTNLPSTFPTTTKAGYNFYGWYLDVKCETLATAGAPLTDNVTLYAKWEEPYEVWYAWNLIDEGLVEKDVNVYVKGYVSAIDDVSGIQKYGNITYTISDDSKTLMVFRGYNLNNEKFTSADQLHLGDVVVVYGKLINAEGYGKNSIILRVSLVYPSCMCCIP